eukprot:GHVN01083075.1.p1 GENE.GHVN01083075.1~~GHVN01083075.1.p1  ORF type:complete len:585 (-),score=49.49 GHVN01083075.1:2574-4328(-)
MYGDQVALIVCLRDLLASDKEKPKRSWDPCVKVIESWSEYLERCGTSRRDVNGRECVIIANTHVLFNKRRGDTKLGQLCQTLSAGWRMYLKYSEVSHSSHVPVTASREVNTQPVQELRERRGGSSAKKRGSSERKRVSIDKIKDSRERRGQFNEQGSFSPDRRDSGDERRHSTEACGFSSLSQLEVGARPGYYDWQHSIGMVEERTGWVAQGATTHIDPRMRGYSPSSLTKSDVLGLTASNLEVNETEGVADDGGASYGCRAVILQNTPCFVLCGDFNIVPQSALYHWLSTGQLDFSNIEFRDASAQNMMFDGSYCADTIGHDYRGSAHGSYLKGSACNTLPSRDLDPATALVNLVNLHRIKEREFTPSVSRGEWMHFVEEEVDLYLCRDLKTATLAEQPQLAFRDRTNIAQTLILHRFVLNFYPLLGESRSTSDMSLSVDEEKDGSDSMMPHKQQMRTGGERRSKTHHWQASLLRLPFKLRSAYSTSHPMTAEAVEPAVTVFHGPQRGCVDYIWFTENETEILAIFELPDLGNLNFHGCIPNKAWASSDHFSLVADLARAPDKNISDVLVCDPLNRLQELLDI